MSELHPFPDFSLPPDHVAHPLKLLGHPLVGGDDFVEGIGDFSVDSGQGARQPNREVSLPHPLQRFEQAAPVQAGIFGSLHSTPIATVFPVSGATARRSAARSLRL